VDDAKCHGIQALRLARGDSIRSFPCILAVLARASASDCVMMMEAPFLLWNGFHRRVGCMVRRAVSSVHALCERGPEASECSRSPKRTRIHPGTALHSRDTSQLVGVGDFGLFRPKSGSLISSRASERKFRNQDV